MTEKRLYKITLKSGKEIRVLTVPCLVKLYVDVIKNHSADIGKMVMTVDYEGHPVLAINFAEIAAVEWDKS